MRRGCCCKGGSQQEGNSECVPLCTGNHVYNFSLAISHAGWSRGTPGGETEFENCPVGECCGGKYMEVRKRDNVVGKFTGRYHADGLANPADLCQCCEIESSNIETPAGSWSADFQYTYSSNTFVRTNYVQDFGFANAFDATFFACAQHPRSSDAFCQCPAVAPAGFWDVIRIVAGGTNLVSFPANDYLGTDCGLNSTSDYVSTHSARLWYVKPVPFASCRTLAGTYRLACARFLVPATPWIATSSDATLYGYRIFVGSGACKVEELGDAWNNDPIFACGSDAGFSVPQTLTVT